MGYLLKYQGTDLLINPGQAVRGGLLLLLIFVFLKDICTKINAIRLYLIFVSVFFTTFLVFLFLKSRSFFALFEEVNYISKILLVLLLIYYVSKHYGFFAKRLDKIMKINFVVFTLNILGGYITGFGLSTYVRVEESSKGMFYGGNPVSILSLVFVSYFLFRFGFKAKNILFVILAVITTAAISTKALFILPVLFLVFFYHKFLRERIYEKIYFSFLTIPLLTIILIICTILVLPSFKQFYQDKYDKTVARSFSKYKTRERVFDSTITAPLEMVAYRRVFAAKKQMTESTSDIWQFLLGRGKTGQKKFWIEEESSFHDAAMDFFDIFFQYGVIGATLIYSIIIVILFHIFRKRQTDFISIIILLMFSYSFFAGHVMESMTSGTVFALFLGMKHRLISDKSAGDEFQD